MLSGCNQNEIKIIKSKQNMMSIRVGNLVLKFRALNAAIKCQISKIISHRSIVRYNILSKSRGSINNV